jgi:hypothetical protein
MNSRAVCRGSFSLPLTVAEALPLFTPEGERDWAGSSWDPIYAIPGAASDDSAPGTVFTTESAGGRATWIVLERHEYGMRYARIAPERTAGTIEVVCTTSACGEGTDVTVTYDVTSLGPLGHAFVEELQAGYDAFLESWRRDIVTARARC